jgi:hypothetical protein
MCSLMQRRLIAKQSYGAIEYNLKSKHLKSSYIVGLKAYVHRNVEIECLNPGDGKSFNSCVIVPPSRIT